MADIPMVPETPSSPTKVIEAPAESGAVPLIDDTNIADSDEGVLQITSVYSLASEDDETAPGNPCNSFVNDNMVSAPRDETELEVTQQTDVPQAPEVHTVPELAQKPEVTSHAPKGETVPEVTQEPEVDSGGVVSYASLVSRLKETAMSNIYNSPKAENVVSKPDSKTERSNNNANEEDGEQNICVDSVFSLKERYILPKTALHSVVANNIQKTAVNSSSMMCNTGSTTTAAAGNASQISQATSTSGKITSVLRSPPITPKPVSNSPVQGSISLRAEPIKGSKNVVQLQPVANVKDASGQTIQIPINITPISTAVAPAPSVGSTAQLVSRMPNVGSTSTVTSSPLNIRSPAFRVIRTPQSKKGVPTLNVGTSTPAPQAARPTLPQQQVLAQPPRGIAVTNAPRLVLVKRTGAPSTEPGQLVYIVDTKNPADGKPLRILIPESATSGQNISLLVPTSTSTASPQVSHAVKMPPSTSTATAQVSQAVKISPSTSTATAQVSQAVEIPPSTSTATPQVPQAVKFSSVAKTIGLSQIQTLSPAVTPKPTSNTSETSTTVSPTLHTGMNTTPTATPGNQKLFFTDGTSQTDVDDIEMGASRLASPVKSSEPITDDAPASSLEPGGMSPHEARIKKLKELLKKQEEAVEKLREKRRHELDSIRESPPLKSASNTESAPRKTSSDSPFLVPLPPKKAKTSKSNQDQGFLPTGDDSCFVKLVGLEKVVQKITDKNEKSS